MTALSYYKTISSLGMLDFSMCCHNPSSKMAIDYLATTHLSPPPKIPTQFHHMQPYTICKPPPNLTRSDISLTINIFPILVYTYPCPMVLYDNITHFQSSTVQCWHLRAKENLLFLWSPDSGDYFVFTQLSMRLP